MRERERAMMLVEDDEGKDIEHRHVGKQVERLTWTQNMSRALVEGSGCGARV
jgi:hypothetical protein